MIIYKDMEPQPEIDFYHNKEMNRAAFWVKGCNDDGELLLPIPYKPGDEIIICLKCGGDVWIEDGSALCKSEPCNWMGKAISSIVKSIGPENKDGRWQWEIEV